LPNARGVRSPYYGPGCNVRIRLALDGGKTWQPSYRQHRSVPEIHSDLRARGLEVCERTVTNLLDRYDELLAVRLGDSKRLKELLAKQGRVVLAIDGLQPDVGHEVLWVLRDCLSGEVLLAKSLLRSTEKDHGGADRAGEAGPGAGRQGQGGQGDQGGDDPDRGGGERRAAVDPQRGGPGVAGVPHQLCQFHYLKEAGKPIYEMDHHAKKS